MTFLLANWRWALIAALIASTGLFFKLWREDVRAFNAYKIEVAALGKAAEMEKKRIEANHNKATKEIKDAIQKQITAARAGALRNYIARMPNNPCGSSVPSAPDSPGRTDDPGKEPLVACTGRFIEDAAADALQVGQFQDWVRKTGFPMR